MGAFFHTQSCVSQHTYEKGIRIMWVDSRSSLTMGVWERASGNCEKYFWYMSVICMALTALPLTERNPGTKSVFERALRCTTLHFITLHCILHVLQFPTAIFSQWNSIIWLGIWLGLTYIKLNNHLTKPIWWQMSNLIHGGTILHIDCVISDKSNNKIMSC